MDGRSDQENGVRRRATSWLARAAMTAVVVGSVAGPAGASPIRAHHRLIVSSEASLGPAWKRFLDGGPAVWEVRHAPRFPSGLALAERAGAVVETPFVDYLTWRRSLDPARFDRVHPNIAPLLTQLLVPPPPTSATPVPDSTTRGGTPPFNPQPQGIPEPGTLPVALILLGAGLGYRARVLGRVAADGRC